MPLTWAEQCPTNYSGGQSSRATHLLSTTGQHGFPLELGPSCHPLPAISRHTPKVRFICKALGKLLPSYGLAINPRLITC